MIREVAMFDAEMRRQLGITPLPTIVAAVGSVIMLAHAEEKARLAPKLAVPAFAKRQ